LYNAAPPLVFHTLSFPRAEASYESLRRSLPAPRPPQCAANHGGLLEERRVGEKTQTVLLL
jgi:hypothetical protein